VCFYKGDGHANGWTEGRGGADADERETLESLATVADGIS
jgi:hypothetical protein